MDYAVKMFIRSFQDIRLTFMELNSVRDKILQVAILKVTRGGGMRVDGDCLFIIWGFVQ